MGLYNNPKRLLESDRKANTEDHKQRLIKVSDALEQKRPFTDSRTRQLILYSGIQVLVTSHC